MCWRNRYKIHNEAFIELGSGLGALLENSAPEYRRSVLVPLIVLGLVSRPGTSERSSCLTSFQHLKDFLLGSYISATADVIPNPSGGRPQDLDLCPVDKLDAYSVDSERERKESAPASSRGLALSTTEGNWNHMLERLRLDLRCKIRCHAPPSIIMSEQADFTC